MEDKWQDTDLVSGTGTYPFPHHRLSFSPADIIVSPADIIVPHRDQQEKAADPHVKSKTAVQGL